MKSKMRKKLIAFMLCMVLVICNSVSILADTPAPETKTTQQVKETKTVKEEKASEESKTAAKDSGTSEQSEEEKAPEVKTTEKKEETTKATTESKKATTEVAEETTTEAKEDKTEATTEAAEETSTTEEKKETSDSSEEDKKENKEATTTEGKEETAPTELTFENDDVIVTVSEVAEGAIPEGAELKVVPILEEDDNTRLQYEEVQKQLQNKALEIESEIKGFLAYDIFFVDENGNEIEPSSEVKVSMKYKQAAIPAEMTTEDAQNAEVSVMHLEEDTDGNVTEVVDMGEAGKVDTLETTDENKVEKLEVKTESFSSFVIIWNYRYTVNVYYFDSDGNEIEDVNVDKNQIYLSAGKNANLEDYAVEIEGYSYEGAHVNSYDGIEVYSVKHDKNGWTYKKREQGRDTTWQWYSEERNVYLVYNKVEQLTTVETVDNNDAGITMRMIDYDSPASLGGSYGDGNVKQGLLNNVLSNGYPTSKEGRSLASLFSGGTNVNHLFIKDTYNSTGYYEYSSFENYAYLGNGSNFTVYNQLGTPKDEEAFFYKRGNFMPYNKIEAGKFSTNTNLYDENGKELNSSDARYNEKLYLTQGTNYYFGMYMEVNFLQPKDGYALHNESSNPMIYEFNGDDDLWVYIDDVLVLDIGGIHDAHSGYINFATGDVHVECIDSSGANQNTTIKQMYWNARKFPDGTSWSNWNDPKVDQFFEGDTFRDYTTHTLKMFYMERGAGASNLHMKFNLQTVPSGAIEVTKELSNTDKEKYANVQFAFQVYAQKVTDYDKEGNEIYSDTEYETLNQAINKDTKEGITFQKATIEGKEYQNVFYLKPGETAQFSDLQNNRKYYVKEIGVKTNEYDKVIINGTEIKNFGEEGEITSSIENIESPKEEVYKRPAVVFENNCSALNSRELWITKNMTGNQTTTDTFDFKVQLSNQDGHLVDYVGDYYLMKDGNYYYYDNNELKSNGTTSKVCGTTSDGIIENVGVGYTVKLTGILSGTKYKVWEIDPNTGLSEEKYNDPLYTSDDENAVTDENASYTSGNIELGENVKITVTNALLSEEDQPMIRVQKTFEGLTEEAIGNLSNDFCITVKDNSDEEVAVLKIRKNASEGKMEGVIVQGPEVSGTASTITYTWEVHNVEAGTYKVVENGTDTSGYVLKSTTVNGNPYDSNTTVTTQNPTFNATEVGRITSQETTKYKFNNVDVIVISLTDTETTEYVVWSEDKLSAGERKGLQEAISEAGKGQFGDSNFGTSTKISFFSSRELIEKGFYYRGKISVDSENNLVFEGGKRQWNMIWLGSYERTGAVDAEIEVINTYGTATMNVDLQKFGTDYTVPLSGAKFELYKGTDDSGNINWNTVVKEEISVDNASDIIELEGLESGYYRLKEIQAPEGYQILDSDIYFKVDSINNTLVLVDMEGNELTETNNLMWRISSNNSKQIQIKNNTLYSLPSAGGPGIYWYTLSGILLMLGAALIVYKQQRKREVLLKK